MNKRISWIAGAVAFASCATVVFIGLAAGADDLEERLAQRAGSVAATADNAPDARLVPGVARGLADLEPASVETESDGYIVVPKAKVEIPKGEGYEATITANGQGLLAELGLCQLDAEGNVVVDDNGESVRRVLKRGLVVQKGDVLGKQQDDELIQERIVAMQELLVAKKEADKRLEIEVAEAAALVAQESYKRVDALNKKMPGSVSEEEVQEKYYDWIRAMKSIEKAKYDREVNEERVKVAEARVNATNVQIRNRKLRAPISGIIDDVYVNEGEWLREGTEALHILRLDSVLVTGSIDALKYAPEDIDQHDAVITVKRPGAPEPVELTGKITYVRQVVESGHYYFYAEVKNTLTDTGYWTLNPGALVTIRIARDAAK